MRSATDESVRGLRRRRAEVDVKLGVIRAWLDDSGLTGIVLGSQANFAWITAGGRSHISIGEETGIASVLVTQEEAYVLTTNIEASRLLDEEIAGLPFEVHAHPWHEADAVRKLVEEMSDPAATVGDGSIGGWPAVDPSFTRLRYTLSEAEADRYRALGRDAATAVETACRAARPGMSELDIAAQVAYECTAKDILPLVDLVAADDRIAAYRHPLPTSKPVARTLLVALTGRRHGLHASLTRMVCFGRPDDDLRRRHDSVIRVDACEIEASWPGRSLGEVMRKGADRYAAQGFPDEWKLRHQGGLTGYAGREVFATPSSSYILEAGNALAWNPSITRVKSEDTVLITDDGFEVLTRSDQWPEHDVDIDGVHLPRPTIWEDGTRA